jgi:sulfoxide reductase heme-binding subunit YedZ
LTLTGWCSLALLAMMAAALAWSPDVEGIRMAVRATARSSLILFLLAYGASAANALWPADATRWMLARRRQWGWLFMISHTLHAAALVAFMVAAPDVFYARVPMATWITGGLAYAVIWSMGITSFDRTAGWLGPKAWRLLHTWGGHYIWLSFLLANGKRIAAQPIYLLPAALTVAVLLMRWWAARKLRAGPATVAPA